MEEGRQRRLIHDLQSFLWQFEQGGYTRDTMQEILKKLEGVLEEDGHLLGGSIERHMQKMMRDCQAYSMGGGNPVLIVDDLDQLRQDLEKI
ncbi:MAG: hypothetical protein K1060chlam2_00332 [Chlamydiae bacterium]|nr:hypothetical protein [Chlamydiota bacterium]